MSNTNPTPTKSNTLQGEVHKIDYKSDESAFAVVSISTTEGIVSAVGPLGHLVPGTAVSLTGSWKFSPNYGEQFEAKQALVDSPQTKSGLQLYLKSQMSGVGAKTAERIVEHFGLETVQILNTAPLRLAEIKGISKKKAEAIAEQWQQDVQTRELEIMLRGYGLGTALCLRLVRKYKSEALRMVLEHPYQLCEEFKGVGFKTADKIALEQGMALDHPERIMAIIQHILKQQEQDGHCYTPEHMLQLAAQQFEVPQNKLDQCIQQALNQETLIFEDQQRVYARPLVYHTERKIAKQILQKLQTSRPMVNQWTGHQNSHVVLNIEQSNGVQQSFQHGVSIITGGPGTGKTTTLRTITDHAQDIGETWLLAAPTGRAAKRLAESTGQEAQTIHRLLKINDAGIFQHNVDNPLECDGILVDEASMLDIWLLNALLNASKPYARLVLVGDVEQLPSVGTGQALKDLIDSDVIPVTRLTRIYRQAQNSSIIQNAHRINTGTPPVSSEQMNIDGLQKDFFVIDRETQESTLQTILHILQQKIPSMGFDVLQDVQVLTPMHGGILGTQNLNQQIQALINPTAQEIKIGTKRFRVGDRVIQLKNDYEQGIFNGDVGTIQKIENNTVYVEFDGYSPTGVPSSFLHPPTWIGLTTSQMLSVDLAYAISIHKSQGSEYPVVILALHKAHWIMLRRKLIYTGLTRAKKFCCIVGSTWALQTAVEQQHIDDDGIRRTELVRWLQTL